MCCYLVKPCLLSCYRVIYAGMLVLPGVQISTRVPCEVSALFPGLFFHNLQNKNVHVNPILLYFDDKINIHLIYDVVDLIQSNTIRFFFPNGFAWLWNAIKQSQKVSSNFEVIVLMILLHACYLSRHN